MYMQFCAIFFNQYRHQKRCQVLTWQNNKLLWCMYTICTLLQLEHTWRSKILVRQLYLLHILMWPKTPPQKWDRASLNLPYHTHIYDDCDDDDLNAHSFSRSVAVKTAGNIVLVCVTVHVNLGKWLHALLSHPALNESQGYWAIQRSWFARVNVLCNLSQQRSRERLQRTSGPISE